MNIINKIKKNKLIKDNITLFLGNALGAFFTFLFHFYMGRKLGPEDYGALGAILAIIYLFTIPITTIQTSIAKFASNFKAKNEINYLFEAATKKLFIYSLIGSLIFIILSPLISSYLHIKIFPLLMLSLFIISSVMLYINRGLLQGLQRFKNFSLNLILEGLIKFLVSLILVFAGFKLNGAVGAIIFSYISVFLISLHQIRDVFKFKIKKFNSNKIYKYSFPVLLTLLALTALYSIDVLLIKHFFVDERAGYYVAISLLGKVLFFGSLPITQVMFPKVSEFYYKKKLTRHLLYKSILIQLVFMIPLIIIYFLFPEFILNFLYGSSYLETSNLLGWFAVIMALFSLIYLIAFYNLSIHRKGFLYILFLFNILELVLIYLFHESLSQVVIILLILMFILLFVMFLYTILKNETKHNNSST